MTQVSLKWASTRESAPSLIRPVFKVAGLLAVGLMVSGAPAFAKNGGGGTAKPPKPGTTVPTSTVPVTVPLPPPVQSPPSLSTAVTNIAGFGVTGFVQSATRGVPPGATTADCPAEHLGGTVLVNGRTIIVPCNTVVQFPANTLNWAQLFTTAGAPLGLDGSVGNATATFNYPSTEISVTGNIVNGKSIAGLITFSQQSLNNGAGYITQIDFATGTILVADSRTDTKPPAKLIINDPEGRFGGVHTPDDRFSVDNENPTIIANSGYPMCVPTSANDSDCPQKNRPKFVSAASCRNFLAAGVTSPAGWELAAPVAGQTYCPAFVMESVAVATADLTKPDPRKQAPLEVGDYIEYSGTLLRSKTSSDVTADTISVHTIHANVGIFTAPGTLPVYLSIEESIIGTDAVPIAGEAPALPALEGQDRFVVVGTTTDVTTPVDVYLIDSDPVTGEETHRWITPESMTGGIAPGSPPFLGGIMTQYTGPQPGRFRMRANKPPAGILASPTRNVRVVARTLCAPASATAAAVAATATSPATPARTYYDINGTAPNAEGTGTSTCLQRDEVGKKVSTAPLPPRGIYAGQYLAPVSEYIFPENVVAGDPLVPYNFWALGFLSNGEGAGLGPLKPTPY